MNKENDKRIFYIDFTRGLAIFFMIMQHAMIMHEVSSGEGNSLLGNFFILLGTAPAAPVFIIILGTFLKSSASSIKKSLIRGTKLIILGYLLNIVRFSIPVYIAGGPYLPGQSPLSLFFTIDILQMTGLSLLIFSGLKKYSDKKFIFPVLILFILASSPYLWGIFPYFNEINPFFGTGSVIEFPLFPWVIYFLLGMYLSKYLLLYFNKTTKKSFIFYGTVLIITGIFTFDIFPIGDYYRSGLRIHFIMIGFTLIWFVLCSYLAKLVEKQNFINNTISFWSRNVTSMYIIQWIIYGWSILILNINKFSAREALIIGIFVFLLTHLITVSFNLIKIKYSNK